MKKIIYGAFALSSLLACSQDKTLLEVTEKQIGTGEDSLSSADGTLQLRFPAGALGQPTNIKITIERGTKPGDALTPTYNLEPDGLVFQKPVQIVFKNADRPDSVVAQIIEGDEMALLESSVQDLEAKVATAELAHFSRYALVQLRSPCANLSCGDTCFWCDPAVPGCVEPPPAKVCSRFGFCVVDRPGLTCPSTGNPDASVEPDASEPADSGMPGTPDASIGQVFEEIESNNSTSTANDPGAGAGTTVIHGAIGPGAPDEDHFMIVVPAGLTATLTAITSSSDTDVTQCAAGTDTLLRLLDGAGSTLAQNDDRNGFCSQIDATLVAGTYFVRVSSFASGMSIASYYLHLSLTFSTFGGDAGVGQDAGAGQPDASPSQPDGSFFPTDAGSGPDAGLPSSVVSEIEPNNPVGSAQPVSLVVGTPTTIAGGLTAGDSDYFLFAIAAGQTLTIEARTYSTLGDPLSCMAGYDTWLEIQDSTGNTVFAMNDDEAGRRPCSGLSVSLGEGEYVAMVRHFAPNQTLGQYFLDLTAL